MVNENPTITLIETGEIQDGLKVVLFQTNLPDDHIVESGLTVREAFEKIQIDLQRAGIKLVFERCE